MVTNIVSLFLIIPATGYFSNHRIIKWLKLAGTFGGHLVQSSAQKDTCRTGYSVLLPNEYEYLQERRFYSIPGQPVLVLCHLHKTCFLMFRWNLLCFILFIVFCSGTEYHWKSLALLSLHFPFKYESPCGLISAVHREASPPLDYW